MMHLDIPRVVMAAPHGRSGKTTATIGLLSALKSAGYRVQSYKKGPDFIDPSWMTRITGRPCRNLDSFLMDREIIRASFARSAMDVDIAVVEGAMGLFDGVDLEGSGSTAEVAKAIAAPVLLVVDTTRMTRSVAAMVSGYQHFDPGVQVAGVILNKVARPRHENLLRAAIERYCGIPVLGVIPKGEKFRIPDRHLGLVPAAEDDDLAEAVDGAGGTAGAFLDLPGIINVARQAPPLGVQTLPGDTPVLAGPGLDGLKPAMPRARVAVFWDRAFTFYYPENLEALVAAGAELVPVNALVDTQMPRVDAAYIGGGFPEIFAGEISANRGLLSDLRGSIEAGLPVYAECGGLMFLGRSIRWRGAKHAMTGALPFEVTMLDKPQGHGYITLEVENSSPYFEAGESLQGHEFHNSRVENLEEDKIKFAFRVTRGHGINGAYDGLLYKNVLACYTHLHALVTTNWASRLVAAGEKYGTGK
ncbi:cobyrinate a,c-diamide synthase [Desulfallas thermosapovorans]|uniref:Cobyrinate a,c-diamide synthase n=1 Tax=Desulfallas thermosapovorans DSM 6562 TaxID=1121431 RepID=A0A5S4ZU57_9FIRM|nr:cobyrinate a,c-diamide synthase [Desulfallas thermosapovorans]TYO96517.1 cobyrinic acid a,c-diamide synthase [Desulfallas thermosapovorans DSM 6562]